MRLPYSSSSCDRVDVRERRPVEVELEDDVAAVGVLHEDVERRPVAEDRLELPVVVVDHQALTRLTGPRADLVEVLGVGDPVGFGLQGGVRARSGRPARPEELDADGRVLGDDRLDVRRRPRPADVDVARPGLEPVLVEQRAIGLAAQAAERVRLDVAVAHLAQAAEDLLRSARPPPGWRVKPICCANVKSWTEILLVGTPLPHRSDDDAAAVAAAPTLRHAASSAATRPRAISPRRCE